MEGRVPDGTLPSCVFFDIFFEKSSKKINSNLDISSYSVANI